jgi:hypothetical protein
MVLAYAHIDPEPLQPANGFARAPIARTRVASAVCGILVCMIVADTVAWVTAGATAVLAVFAIVAANVAWHALGTRPRRAR